MSCLSQTDINKSIKKTVKMSSSSFTMKMSSIMVSKSNEPVDVGVGKKNNSYNRYLARKKAPHIIQTNEIVQNCSC